MRDFVKNNIVFILMIIVFFCVSTQLNANENTNEMKDIKILSDSVDITKNPNHSITFKSIENPNIASGKIAPGSAMYTILEVDFNQNKKPFDVKIDIDKTFLNKLDENFEFNITIDGEEYILGNKKELSKDYVENLIDQSKNLEIYIELSWKPESQFTPTTLNNQLLDFPMHVQVDEHI